MPISNNILAGSGQGGGDFGDPIEQSLRFDGTTATHYLENTNITIQATSTASMWVKIAGTPAGTRGHIFGASRQDGGLGDVVTAIGWRSDSKKFHSRNTTDTQFVYSDIERADFSAWYHLVVQFDASLQMKLFVNGVQQANTAGPLNPGGRIIIGRNRSDSQNESFNGYLAALYYVDGQILEPTEFGRYNGVGVCVPKDYTGTYGTNGFKLTFDSTQDANPAVGIGIDSSGNNHHFTSGGFNTTAVSSSNFSTDIDILDTPTNNWCTGNYGNRWGELDYCALGFKNATNTRNKTQGTIAFPESGVWQFEYKAHAAYQNWVGFHNQDQRIWHNSASYNPGEWKTNNAGQVADNGTTINGAIPNTANGDIITCILDFDTDVVRWYNNGSLIYTISSIPEPTYFYMALVENYNNGNEFNFGQYAFSYTPVAGAKPLNLNNCPEPTIKDGSEHFRAIVAEGDGVSSAGANQTAGNFSPFLFTAPGTSTNPVGSTDTDWLSGYTTAGVFTGTAGNATTADSVGPNDNDGWLVFRPETPIAGVTKIRVYTRISGSTGDLFLNGVQQTAVAGTSGNFQYVDIPLGYSTITLSELAMRDASSSRMYWGAIEINDNMLVDLNILTVAQQAFPNALYWIKDRENNSTKHQMFNSISGTSTVSTWPAVAASTSYVNPSGNSVAWVWSAPDTFTGTTNTTCRKNDDAGFTMVDSGTNILSTYEHGLGQIPDWMIIKNHAGQNFSVS